VANRDALTAVIVEGFACLTAAEAVARLDAAGIANARVNDMRHCAFSSAMPAVFSAATRASTSTGRMAVMVCDGADCAAARPEALYCTWMLRLRMTSRHFAFSAAK
jgi:itaconate CoA-transferase